MALHRASGPDPELGAGCFSLVTPVNKLSVPSASPGCPAWALSDEEGFPGLGG